MNTSGADEQIVLQISSKADASGVKEMRTETTSLADAAVKASQAMTAEQGKLAQATRAAAAEQGKLVATIEQVRLAQERSGGDFQKFKVELASLVRGQEELAAATETATKAIERQAKATVGDRPLGPFPVGPRQFGPFQAGDRQLGPFPAGDRQMGPFQAGSGQLGPAIGPSFGGPQLGPALPDTRLAAEAERSAAALDKVNPKMRSAGNALNLLAVSAANGTGSIAGLTVALGNVAQGMTAMSSNAAVAASSAGIGALAAAVAVLIALSIDAAKKLKEIPEGKLSGAAAAHLKNLHTEQEVQEELARVDARRQGVAAQTLTTVQKLFDVRRDPLKLFSDDEQALQAVVDLDATRLALGDRLIQIKDEERRRTLAGIAIEVEAQTTATGRRAARLRQIDAERLESIRTHELTEEAADRRAASQRRALDKEAAEYRSSLQAATASAWGALNQDVFDQRREAEDLAYAKEKKALNDRTLSTEQYKADLAEINRRHEYAIELIEKQRTAAIAMSSASRAAGSDDPRVADAGKRLLIEEERKADVQRVGAAEAELIAKEKLRKLEKQRVDEGLAGYGKLAAAVKNHGTLVGAMAKASSDAVRLYEIYTEGKKAGILAQMEFAASTAAFASGNVVGGTLHLAAAGGYAAAAVAAGAEAYGVVHSGGGSSASGGGSALDSSSTFQPRNADGAGNITVILQGVHTSSREVVDEARYQVARAANLKRPIPIAATVGISRAA
jgi:hypothetical protein